MSTPSWMDRTGATPKKLALVAVLAVVLVIVIWRQVFGSDEPEVAVKPRKPAATSPKSKSSEPKPAERADEQAVATTLHAAHAHEWPEMPVSEVVTRDPFRQPDWYAFEGEEAVERISPAFVDNRDELLEQLKQKSTNIVVVSGSQKVAILGGREVRVGDLVEGFQVTDITTEGIVLSETKTRQY